MSSIETFISKYAYSYSMSSSDIENTASEVSMHVDDLLYEVRAMREALEMLQNAVEEGLNELPDI